MPTSLNRFASEKNLVFLVLLTSFVLKGILVFSSQVPNPDGVLYIDAARHYAQGNFQQGITVYRMPFYPLLIAGFHVLIPDWLRAAQAISWLSLVLAIIPLYQISKTLFGDKPALWSITAFALAPHFNTPASEVIRDPLGLFLFALAVLYAIKSLQNKKTTHFALASIFAILATLCRVEFFLLPILLLLFYLGIALVDRHQTSSLSLAKGIAVFMVIPLFCGILLWLLVGEGVDLLVRLDSIRYYLKLATTMDFSGNYQNISKQLKLLGHVLPYSSYTGNFAETARHYIGLIYFIGLLEAGAVLLFPANVIPLTQAFKTRHYVRSHYLLIATIVLFTLSAYFFLISRNFIQKRYFLMPIFFLFPWVGNGLYRLQTKAAACKNGRIIAFSLLLLFFLLLPIGKTLSYAGEKNLLLKEAGLWLADNIAMDNHTRMVSNDRRLGYFSGLEGKQRFFFRPKLQSIEKYALKKNARLLFLTVPAKRQGSIPAFSEYQIIKKFCDQDNYVILALNYDN